MLAQPESSRAGEKAVIDGFNTRLAAKIAAFTANNTGVCSSLSTYVLFVRQYTDVV